MDIKIGDVVEFRIEFNPKAQLGVVQEITEVKESINSERVGTKEYHVNTLDNTINYFTLVKENIVRVYINVESEAEQQ